MNEKKEANKNLNKLIQQDEGQAVQTWFYNCYFHPLQVENCPRNSRLVVDENDIKWVANEKIYR